MRPDERCEIRELSMHEAEMVGGGFFGRIMDSVVVCTPCSPVLGCPDLKVKQTQTCSTPGR